MLEKLRHEFREPSDAFTAVPLWFWNDDLNENELLRQVRDFKDKGVMGFVIHPRMGITQSIPYMSDRYLRLVETVVEEADLLGMTVFLYDEASYPSGSAHGMVVQGNPEYASRGLKMIEFACEGETELSDEKIVSTSWNTNIVSIQAVKKISDQAFDLNSAVLLALEDHKVRFKPPDMEHWSILVFADIPTFGKIRGIHFGEDDYEPGALASADILNRDAVRKFIDLTHERYYQRLRKFFGTTIQAIFTDEPGIMGRRHRPDLFPWTGGFLNWYKQCGGREIDLPVLWLDAGEETESIRSRYRQAVNRLLVEAYYKQISRWCEEHGIALTGHPEKSEDIGVLKHFQIPCQDIVWRWVAPENNLAVDGINSTMGKCSSDAARHAGRRRNGNECLGCCFRNGKKGTTYDLPPEDIKWYLDWLFVRGVNLILPHAFYYSVDGARRLNERPPDVGPNNLFWPHFNIISDYIKRMSWLMTNSVNQARVAVLCTHDRLSWKLAKPLFKNQIEFNYLEEDVLNAPECTVLHGRINIRKQEYATVVCEESWVLCQETEAKLRRFIQSGGSLVIVDDSGRASLSVGERPAVSADSLRDALERILEKDVILDPPNEDIRVSHVVKDGIPFYLLVNEGEEPFVGTVRLRATGQLELWDALDGSTRVIPAEDVSGGYSALDVRLDRRGSCIIAVDVQNANPRQSGQPLQSGSDLGARAGEQVLNAGWQVDQGLVSAADVGELGTWTRWPGMENYSGSVTYRNHFQIDSVDERTSVQIDLGRVCETVQLRINGHQAGVRLWGPFVFDISGLITNGVNTVEVIVTNSLANRVNGARLDSGLLGPVVVQISHKPGL